MEIMDDLLDLRDTLADAVGRHRRRARKALHGQSGFGTLVTVLAIMAVGAIIIAPLLAFVITGTRAGAVHDRITDRLYAADAGIQDGIWRVTDGKYPATWKETWDDDVYADNLTYPLPSLNGCSIDVTIQPVWLLAGLETPSAAQGSTPDPRLVITSNVLEAEARSMQIIIIMHTSIQESTQIRRIGVWLPQGFGYVTGSSSLEQASGAAKCTHVSVQEWKNGNVVLFDYPTPVDFPALPNVSGDRLVIGFSYTGAGAPSSSWAWCRTSSNTDCHLSWSNDIKMFQVKSTATDPVTGGTTSVVAGQMTNESVGTYLAYYGDYAVTGNALMRATSGKVRDRLYQESPGQISVIPASGTARKIILYWSGWKDQPEKAWSLSPTELHQLALTYGVAQVSVAAEYNGHRYELGRVTATEWTVLPNGSPSSQNGWSYGCNADITNLVKSSLPASFVGNATYWVGHIDTETPLPSSQNMNGIWGTSDSNIFMVGNSGHILRYDGTSWSSMTSGTTKHLYGVWGSGPSNVFAVGADGTILRYDGTSWSSMTSSTPNNLYGVWGTAANNVYAVGAGGKILKYDGSTWTSKTGPTPTSTYNQDLHGVWGSSAQNVWAVGKHRFAIEWLILWKYYYTLWQTTNGGGAWGSPYSLDGGPFGYDLNAVWGTAANNVYAVGAGGKILKYDGSSWSEKTSGTSSDLYAVWGSSATDVYAGGAGGTIRHTTNGGTNWTAETSTSSARLNAIWGTGSGSIYAAGNADGSVSTLLRWDGSSWTRIGGGAGTNLWGWGNPHSGDTSKVATTACPLSDVVSNEWANACWSIVTLYTSPETPAHQMYLFNTFRYWNGNDTKEFTLDGFLAPQGINDEAEAVKLSYFVGEGDGWYGNGDNIYLNGTQLNPSYISPSASAPNGNCMNSVSNSGGLPDQPPDDGIDLDTYVIPGSAHLINPRDSSAKVKLTTGTDVWNMVYMILSFRSDNVGSGVLTYILI